MHTPASTISDTVEQVTAHGLSSQFQQVCPMQQDAKHICVLRQTLLQGYLAVASESADWLDATLMRGDATSLLFRLSTSEMRENCRRMSVASVSIAAAQHTAAS